jgi:mRNA interferase RelE/StbE
MYAIEFTVDALKALTAMPRNTARLIRSKIDLLATDPTAPNNNIKRLKGTAHCRLRVGDWRVVYEVQHDKLVIVVIRIAPRGGAYD